VLPADQVPEQAGAVSCEANVGNTEGEPGSSSLLDCALSTANHQFALKSKPGVVGIAFGSAEEICWYCQVLPP